MDVTIHISYWIIPLILTIMYTIIFIMSQINNSNISSMFPDIGGIFNLVIYIIALLFTWLVYFILKVIFS